MPATSDLQRIKELILWCREEAIAWHELKVGDISMVGADTKAVVQQQRDLDAPAPRSIYSDYGPPPGDADPQQTALVDED